MSASDVGRLRRRALWGTLVFVAIDGAAVIVLVPASLTDGWQMAEPPLGGAWLRWLGAAVFLAALPIFVDFLVRFVKDGLGTPVPLPEPERLVVTGVFRSVRNPGYVAVVSMIAGQGLFFGSWPVLAWAGVAAAAFHLFVVLYEEPHLARKFGADYAAYCAGVPRWLPRLRR